MAKKFQSEQEVFWAGSFGDEYTIRNDTKELLLSKKTLLNNALKSSSKLESVIEFGANVGLNLIAVKDLIPGVAATAGTGTGTGLPRAAGCGAESRFGRASWTFALALEHAAAGETERAERGSGCATQRSARDAKPPEDRLVRREPDFTGRSGRDPTW